MGRGELQQFIQVATAGLGPQQLQVIENQGKAFAALLQKLDNGRPQRGVIQAFWQGQLQGAQQMAEKAGGLVVAGIAAVPGVMAVKPGGVLCEQGALAVAQRRTDEGQQAAAVRGVLQALQQFGAHDGIGWQRRGTQLGGVDGRFIHFCVLSHGLCWTVSRHLIRSPVFFVLTMFCVFAVGSCRVSARAPSLASQRWGHGRQPRGRGHALRFYRELTTCPPSTVSTAPVMNAPASLASNRNGPSSSCRLPRRRRGTLSRI
ncbi:hypothetical protein D3C76_674720 [compost metagenome]